MTTEQKLAAALRDSNTLIERAQAILARYLEPESGWGEQLALGELLALLDGPEQRRVQEATRASLEAFAEGAR